jgi:small subunit ribosomal protein S14
MAKKSMINRELKRSRMVAQYADKRASLKKIMADETASYEDRELARLEGETGAP